ncbi:AMP-binding protein [Spirilliplanes yamanashiensis]|uniref:Fatty-acyl-CoA synthase n=1 Tax=Spirilliplanes yamanashiensis TaxID=42233 RepID=A0A8J3YB25_9ACTN|nr:class I adenylate-forming enzyme family protein [Spirilliplanes yamanashiensis]MDP9818799.1 acyl-CoA synthetase (AMP-forming)/AMP-acid ligase II [Spirilliplanes yamanashiensis]GIJ05253.1 fatty-acyl-CoA synthase [Spirilliplanes yamanashiensis]
MLDELLTGLRPGDDTPALLRGRRVLRRGELAELTGGYAAALHRRGLGPGGTLGLAVRPGAHALAVLLAAYRLGVRIAVLDPTAGPDVLTARLAAAPPDLVVADAAAQAVAGWAAPLARRAHLALPDLAALAPTVTAGRRLPGCAPRLAPEAGPAPRHDGDGDAVVVFTSGTTSRPRAVVHTRASVSAGMRAAHDLVRPRPDAPVLGGTFFVLVPVLAAGAPVALPARRPAALARQAAALRPQATYLTPPQLRAALAAGTRFTGRVYSGSAPVGAPLLRAVRAAGADEAWCVYALTEMFPAAAAEAAEKAAWTGDGDLVGAPLPGVRTRLAGDGELLLAGPNAADRYLGEEPAEWKRTGDAARLDGGRIVLAGRLKDMVLRGAENIYPGLYEPSLHVPGVELAVLVGVPGGDGDERLVAVVQPAGGADPAAVRAALRGPLDRMGAARPDAVVLAAVPLAGRSRKPDRAAAARLAAERIR